MWYSDIRALAIYTPLQSIHRYNECLLYSANSAVRVSALCFSFGPLTPVLAPCSSFGTPPVCGLLLACYLKKGSFPRRDLPSALSQET